jgi:hypothetical protein
MKLMPGLLVAFTTSALAWGSVAFASSPQIRSVQDAYGPQFQGEVTPPPPPAPSQPGATIDSWLVHWNNVAIDASGRDHKQPDPGETYTYGHQLGPGRAARAIAIVQIAVFESMNTFGGRYPSYIGMPQVRKSDNAIKAAIATSARTTLVSLFPSQKKIFDTELAKSLALLKKDPLAAAAGAVTGALAANRILAKRSDDGAEQAEPVMDVDYIPSQEPGYWRQDPVSKAPIAMGAHWMYVKPFVMTSAAQFRTPAPPSMDSAEYAAAFDELKRLGGDGIVTPTERTEEQTHMGIFWAYDGTPSLCAPPRLYNQLVQQVAKQKNTTGLQFARLLALVNVAMADAGIGAWESKFHYAVWRPVTGIREADEGTGPTGRGDGNPLTIGDPSFMPLGAPASNLHGPNFTPPFPAYPSGHATFGGSLFQILRRFYGTDDVTFTFVSDEYNGVTRDNTGAVRPYKPRTFTSFTQAEEENARSRIYLGIHWAFDATEGMTQGEQIADYVFERLYVTQK